MSRDSLLLRRLRCAVLAVALTIGVFLPTAWAASGGSKARPAVAGKQYDSQGRYVGRVDDSGRRYDSQGRYLGRIDATGRQYDAQGRYLGRTDESGRLHDAQGRYLGKVDATGRLYDEQGRYKGRMDAEGRQYDAQGRYTGRVELTDRPSGSTPSPDSARLSGRDKPSPTPVKPAIPVAPFVLCAYSDKSCLTDGSR